ncbi:MAG: glycogen/starch synthase, partial [Candidatus Gastranaerophilales bacterium]|nr:glycogen/starch synthase [Candidatus Gastranaerophilales bacterium]
IVTSAIALASLGVATYAIVKKSSGLKSIEQKLETISRDIGENKGSVSRLEGSINGFEGKVNGLEETINGVKGETEKAVGEIRGSLNQEIGNVRGEIDGVRNAAKAPTMVSNMLTRSVEVNGQHMNLASVMHGYGMHEESLTKTLRSEATRRILGAVKPTTIPDNAMIRVPSAEFSGFAKTGGLAIVPRELLGNLGAVVNNKQKMELVADSPMYLGQVENANFFSIVKRPDGKFDYISKKAGKESTMATMTKIDEMHVPIHTNTGKTTERVEVFLTDEMRQPVDYEDTLMQFDAETAKAIKESLDAGKNYDTPLVSFTAPKEKGELPTAEVKFRTVFYKNDKFRMDGPVQEGKIKNIYNDQTTQAGETERNIYFCKYMYENLVNNHESSDKALRADWIIGNDWHTGALSAMTRLLTPARKAMGMEPEAADKLANTPITTLMHNFKLQGSVWHSQDKLLNVMFGEHAAKITENAWMPQNADMPSHLMNGLFSGNAINPQTMAMSYADDIIFVSRGNFNEMATKAEFGGTNYALASMRGRTWQYADKAKLEEIGMASGIRPNEIPEHATAKGITNGCDRVNNILTRKKARKLETDLNLPVGSLKSAEEAILNPYAAHQNNKAVGLRRVIEDLNTAKATGGKENPLKIRDFEHTDLTGVDENTLVFGMAGRIVDQKGIDIYAEGILKMAQRGNYDKANPPVNYLQGIGDEAFIGRFMEVKNKVREIDPKLADRMMFAGVFSEAGRYDCCKMISDIAAMPSWDEPCGLVHKEIGYNSGAISMVNKRGGLTDGLIEFIRGKENKGANSIFVEFMDKETHSYEEALAFNGEKTADGMEAAMEWFKDKQAFAKGVESSYTARHDWLRGKIQEYAEIGKRHGVLKETVDSHYAA